MKLIKPKYTKDDEEFALSVTRRELAMIRAAVGQTPAKIVTDKLHPSIVDRRATLEQIIPMMDFMDDVLDGTA